ncbi:lysylphosphatidylglycerol synthase transmembrane domain-containing protein [Actinoplanes sp. NPDC026619]|uniref:lysylphosphatidylglycerol synthase transmembrane domain-containing protein n=1 Tax=Actinoplanes sp. NPDC026619 TaxID=3155798 RepID=UPI0033D699AD
MSRQAEAGHAPATPAELDRSAALDQSAAGLDRSAAGLDQPVAGGALAAVRKSVLAASQRWWVRALFALVAALIVVVTLRGRMPEPADILAALRDTDARWFAAAIVLQVLSQAAFAWQQRVMLTAFGVRMSPPVAVLIALARSAISLAFPAGGAVSAAYAVGQYRRRGAGPAGAATTMLLSGAASVAGLLLTYGGVAGSSHPATAVVVVVLLLAAGTFVVAVVRTRSRRAVRPPRPEPAFHLPRARRSGTAGSGRAPHLSRAGRAVPPVEAGSAFRLPGAGRATGAAWRLFREARAVRARHLAVTVGFAVLNWLLDLACLVAAARGCGLSLPVAHLATVYLAVQVVRQIPITPGGFGLIEASLLAGLAAAGAPHAAAAAAVLVYRLASCWFVLPLGLVSHLVLRLGARHPAGV